MCMYLSRSYDFRMMEHASVAVVDVSASVRASLPKADLSLQRRYSAARATYMCVRVVVHLSSVCAVIVCLFVGLCVLCICHLSVLIVGLCEFVSVCVVRLSCCRRFFSSASHIMYLCVLSFSFYWF